MVKRPAFVMALCLIGGLVVGQVAPIAPGAALAAVVALVVVQLFAGRRWPALFGGGQLLWLAVVCLGVTQQRQIESDNRVSQERLRAAQSDGYVSLRGAIASDVEPRDDGAAVEIGNCRLERLAETQSAEGADGTEGDNQRGLAIPLKIRLLARGAAADELLRANPARGDAIEVRFALLSTAAMANRDVFNYDAYLLQQGIVASVSCRGAEQLALRPPAGPRRFDRLALRALAAYRTAAIELLRDRMPRAQADLLEAVFFGHGRALTADQRDVFARTGMIHLFSVSGLHTGLVAMFLFALLNALRLSPRAAYVVTCVMMVAYVALMGFAAPVTRAAIMFACLFAPFFLRYKVEALSALSVAAVATLLVNPRALWQISFQLSYLCMFGLVVLLPVLRETLTLPIEPPAADVATRIRQGAWRRHVNNWALTPLQVCLAAQLATLPFQAAYYHRVSLISPIANAAAAIPAFLSVCSTALLVTAGFLGEAVAAPLAAIAQWSAVALEWVAREFAWVPAGSLRVVFFPYWLAALYYLWVYCAPYARPARTPVDPLRRKVALAIRVAGVAALLALLPFARPSDRSLRVTFLDVGQGDACLVEFPDGRAMLVDAGAGGAGSGGRGDMGRLAVTPTLDARGIEQLDLVVATHPDSDHVGGLPATLRALPVALALDSGADKDSEISNAFEDAVRIFARRHETAFAGYAVGGDGYRVECLWPPKAPDAPSAASGDDWNDRSVVIRAQFGQFALLLTGDIDAAVERALIECGAPLQATVLKAAHHGSARSSSPPFLEAVSPVAAVISCGERNRYGHPADEVLERLAAVDALIFRTDREGAIEFKTDGRRLWAHTAGKAPR